MMRQRTWLQQRNALQIHFCFWFTVSFLFLNSRSIPFIFLQFMLLLYSSHFIIIIFFIFSQRLLLMNLRKKVCHLTVLALVWWIWRTCYLSAIFYFCSCLGFHVFLLWFWFITSFCSNICSFLFFIHSPTTNTMSEFVILGFTIGFHFFHFNFFIFLVRKFWLLDNLVF
jgi:hypothetical protein